MTKQAIQNLRLAILVAAMVAGIAVQKHGHYGQHADCDLCIEETRAL